MTSAVKDCALRKSLGAWYTPVSIARPLVKWAIRSYHDHVLDPAVGDGVFLVEAARALKTSQRGSFGGQLHGIDINENAVSASKAALAEVLGASEVPDLRTADFFQIEPPARLFGDLGHVDAVIGNPPYIRYQAFKGTMRATALLQAQRVGVRLSQLSSSWAPFVIHAASFLRPGGRLALVLPEEILHSAYAAEVRRFLRSSFMLTAVVQFDNHFFPDAEERVVLLLADGKDGKGVGELRLVSVRTPEEIGDLRTRISRSELFHPHEEPQKWETQFHDSAASILDRLSTSGFLVPLRSIGKASIGYVTGANKYFVLTQSEARRLRFPASALKPTVLAARHVSGAVFSKADMQRLAKLDERCFLWTGAGADTTAVTEYIEQGMSRGVPSRYKCRVRDPWYVVPGVVEPDAFLTYMSDQIPRFILNGARATCSNTLLAVRLDGVNRQLRSAFVAAFYNSATMLSAERTGRRYGGGVLKLEPSEADRVLVPSPEVCKSLRAAGWHLKRVDALLRSRNIDGVLSEVDELVLRRAFGLNNDDVETIRSSRLRRQEARKRRPRVPARATPTQSARKD